MTASPYIIEAAKRCGIIEQAEASGKEDDACIRAALPAGKTLERAIEVARIYRDRLWSDPDWLRCDEDDRIRELRTVCTEMLGGDAKAGEALARAAI